MECVSSGHSGYDLYSQTNALVQETNIGIVLLEICVDCFDRRFHLLKRCFLRHSTLNKCGTVSSSKSVEDIKLQVESDERLTCVFG